MENVTLNQKEQTRLQILNSLLSEHMTVDQAATLMGVSTRHTWRILVAYTEEGAAALAHGHRGRRAPNTAPDSIRAEVLRLARTTYSGVNHTHLSELLRERDGIDIARVTRCDAYWLEPVFSVLVADVHRSTVFVDNVCPERGC